MRKKFLVALIWPTFLIAIVSFPANPASAASPNLYEPMTGTNGGSLNSVSGSSDSIGFTGNWSKVNGFKSGSDPVLASVFTSSYNSKLAFPSGSRFSVPTSNTAAGTSSGQWHAFHSARQMSSAISFDSTGTYFLSYLMYAPSDYGNWGSAVVGLLNGLPTSNTDTSAKALFFGWTYKSAPVIKSTTANLPVWEGGSYDAFGASSTPAATGDKSWFVIVKITTAASGNDQIQLKMYAPSATIPNSDSSISWDVTYSAAVTGSWGYLSVQCEYNGLIDELRGGLTYDAVAGTASAATVGTPTVTGTIKKGVSATISVEVDGPGFVRFFIDGKRIAGCLKVATSGSAPNYAASCTWKPTIKGARTFTASFTPSDSSFLAANSPSRVYLISNRTNTR